MLEILCFSAFFFSVVAVGIACFRKPAPLKNISLPWRATKKRPGYLIKDDGGGVGCMVYDLRTGLPLDYVTNIEWSKLPGEQAVCKIELLCVRSDLRGYGLDCDIGCQHDPGYDGEICAIPEPRKLYEIPFDLKLN